MVDKGILFAFLLGPAGGALFWLLGVPAPWLTGPLLAVGAAAVAGVPVRSPEWARFLLFVILGVSIGSGIDPASLQRMTQWPASLAIYTVSVVVTVWIGMAYLRRTLRCDRITAMLASIPGTQSLALSLALSFNADVRQVAMMQSLRLCALVLLFPMAASLLSNGGTASAAQAPDAFGPEHVWLLAAAVAGAVVATRFKLPAGALVGAMLVSVVLHASGLNLAQLPPWLVSMALALLGIIVGVRFAGSQPRSLLRTAVVAGGMVALSLAVSVAFALVADAWLGFGFGALLLAYTPGAIEAMTLIASSLGLDPAFVGTHHLVRMVVMGIVLPIIVKRISPS